MIIQYKAKIFANFTTNLDILRYEAFMKKMKRIFAATFAELFAVCVLLASCSNGSNSLPVLPPSNPNGGSGDGSGAESGTGSGSGSGTGIAFTASATNDGIRFEIPALPTQYQSKVLWIQDISDGIVGEGYRATPSNWNKAVAWTGVYKYVTAGKTYKFKLTYGDADLAYSDPVVATAGSGELSTYSSPSVAISWSGDNIFANFQNYNLPDGILQANFQINIYRGNGITASGWDGAWIGFYQTPNSNPPTDIGDKDGINSAISANGNSLSSGQKFFFECTWSFWTPANEDFDCHTPHIFSNAIEWP